MFRHITVFGIAMLCLAGCQRQPVQCTAESAQSTVVDLVKEQLEKSVSGKVRNETGNRSVSLSKIRAAIAQLVIAVDDIRTSKEDPNSTKRFCTGTLKVRFPTEMIADADKARADAQLNTVADLADSNDIEQNADRFSASLDFNIQPTDDGSKVFAEAESGNNMFTFAGDVVAAGLMRSSIEDAQRQEQQAKDQQAAVENAALVEQRNANLESAKTDNQLAEQALTAVWRSLNPDTHGQLLPVQRTWIRKKDADCRVEAASASTDPTEMEIARLNCDTRVSQERTQWLQPYRSADPGSAMNNAM
ncbi:lysozyme inhibitor LprI family protein [Sphingomonas sp.]|uniref:lysozyme inhibitor LprI family protein n=1 Tax=Sphingomonas sp. TaxID=28214 RepID=UPI002E30F4BE|nr:lysozyme inhibitor LprI family protein [Sphingomonas sp.]HEX4695745.1 lysozyme inhibitor LprI family protein [Sphingomonas sp.]